MWTLMHSVLFINFIQLCALDEILLKIPSYDTIEFKQKIKDLDGNFIMFYTPWSKDSKAFFDLWQGLGQSINTEDSRFAIAAVNCETNFKLCLEYHITGYPTLLYFPKKTFVPIKYTGTRDLTSLTFFLNEVFESKINKPKQQLPDEVRIYRGMAFLNEQNVEKFISIGQHFVMFYAPWCKASQRLAPIWAELAVHYATNDYLQIGMINCMENEITCTNFDVKQYPYLIWIADGRIMGVNHNNTFEDIKTYIEKMMLAENHDPDKFKKKKKVLPVARITDDTYDNFMNREIVFVNFFAPWCAHCMQMGPLWLRLGEHFQNESRVLIADVDCARSKTICELENIGGLPTLILYKNKNIIVKENGGQPYETLVSMVKEQLQERSAKNDNFENIEGSLEDNLLKSGEQHTNAKDEL